MAETLSCESPMVSSESCSMLPCRLNSELSLGAFLGVDVAPSFADTEDLPVAFLAACCASNCLPSATKSTVNCDGTDDAGGGLICPRFSRGLLTLNEESSLATGEGANTGEVDVVMFVVAVMADEILSTT